jgi:hypothetical protein
MSFHPFNPRKVRLVALGGAVACGAVALWALWDAAHGLEKLGEARAGLAAGLMFAFLYAFFRLRPNKGWGVTIEPLKLTIARPISGTPIEVLPGQVDEIRRDGKRQDLVAIYLKNGQRILLAQHLFSSPQAFDEVAKAMRAWKPEPPNV